VTDDALFERARRGRPRDVAITDFRLVTKPEAVITGRRGHSYLVYARAPLTHPYDDLAAGGGGVSNTTRRCAEWAFYTLCSGAAFMTIWFAFLTPIAPMPSIARSATESSPAPAFPPGPLDRISLAALRDLRWLPSNVPQ
jgi:hypothetical protein